MLWSMDQLRRGQLRMVVDVQLRATSFNKAVEKRILAL